MRQVNLLPEELKKAERVRPIRASIIATLIWTFFVVLIIHLLLVGNVNRLEKKVNQLSLVQETTQIRQLRQKIAQLKKENQKFMGKDKAISDILSVYLAHPHILKVIADITAERVWLKEFSIKSQKLSCQISGSSFNPKLVSEFMLELKKSPYFDNINLTFMEKATGSGHKEVNFKIICNIK